MSVVIMLEFKVAPERVESVTSFLRKVLPDTRAFEGCETLSLVQDQDDPTAFAFIERWSSRAAYEKYLAWRTETGALNDFVAMIAGGPTFHFFDHVGV